MRSVFVSCMFVAVVLVGFPTLALAGAAAATSWPLRGGGRRGKAPARMTGRGSRLHQNIKPPTQMEFRPAPSPDPPLPAVQTQGAQDTVIADDVVQQFAAKVQLGDELRIRWKLRSTPSAPWQHCNATVVSRHPTEGNTVLLDVEMLKRSDSGVWQKNKIEGCLPDTDLIYHTLYIRNRMEVAATAATTTIATVAPIEPPVPPTIAPLGWINCGNTCWLTPLLSFWHRLSSSNPQLYRTYPGTSMEQIRHVLREDKQQHKRQLAEGMHFPFGSMQCALDAFHRFVFASDCAVTANLFHVCTRRVQSCATCQEHFSTTDQRHIAEIQDDFRLPQETEEIIPGSASHRCPTCSGVTIKIFVQIVSLPKYLILAANNNPAEVPMRQQQYSTILVACQHASHWWAHVLTADEGWVKVDDARARPCARFHHPRFIIMEYTPEGEDPHVPAQPVLSQAVPPQERAKKRKRSELLDEVYAGIAQLPVVPPEVTAEVAPTRKVLTRQPRFRKAAKKGSSYRCTTTRTVPPKRIRPEVQEMANWTLQQSQGLEMLEKMQQWSQTVSTPVTMEPVVVPPPPSFIPVTNDAPAATPPMASLSIPVSANLPVNDVQTATPPLASLSIPASIKRPAPVIPAPVRGFSCTGCEDFVCVAHSMSLNIVQAACSNSTVEVVLWAHNHRLTPTQHCSKCQTETAKFALTVTKLGKTCRLVCRNPTCRTSVSLKRDTGFVFPDVIEVMALLSEGGIRVSKFHKLLQRNKTTVVKMIDRFHLMACYWNTHRVVVNRSTIAEAETDESFLGARKHERGKRSRQQGIITIHGMCATGTRFCRRREREVRVIQEGFSHRTSDKSATSVLPLLYYTLADGASIRSDGATVYRSVGLVNCTHNVVNHQRGFVAHAQDTGEATSTQCIESFWSAVKRRMRSLWARPTDNEWTARAWQLSAFLANCNLESPTFTHLFVSLLKLTRWTLEQEQEPWFDDFHLFALEWCGALAEEVEGMNEAD
jgi:hypothetical protein